MLQLSSMHLGKSDRALPQEDALQESIQACAACERACRTYAEFVLTHAEIRSHVDALRLSLHCSELCAHATEALRGTRNQGLAETIRLVQQCVGACIQCAAECHAVAERELDGRRCAEVCVIGARACRQWLSTVQKPRPLSIR